MSGTKCQVCNNTTTDPSGFCYLHRGTRRAGANVPKDIPLAPTSAFQASAATSTNQHEYPEYGHKLTDDQETSFVDMDTATVLGSNLVAVRDAPDRISESDSAAFDYAEEHGVILYSEGGRATTAVDMDDTISLVDQDTGTVLSNNVVAVRNMPMSMSDASDSDIVEYAREHGTRLYI